MFPKEAGAFFLKPTRGAQSAIGGRLRSKQAASGPVFEKRAPKPDPKTPRRKSGPEHGVHDHRAAPPWIDEYIVTPLLPDRCPCGGKVKLITEVVPKPSCGSGTQGGQPVTARRADLRSRYHQSYCSKPDGQKASKAARQRKWRGSD